MRFTPRGAAAGRAVPRLQLTTMIDVVFLLLIFFLSTISFARPESELSSALQTERGGGRAADLQPQIIEATLIGGVPTYLLGDRTARDKQSLTAILRQLPKETGVFVRVSGDVSVGFAAAAIQACRDAGFSRVSYVPQE